MSDDVVAEALAIAARENRELHDTDAKLITPREAHVLCLAVRQLVERQQPQAYEYTREWIFSIPPVSNPITPSPEAVLERMAADGWEFMGLIPGVDHPIAEHIQPTQYIFRRVRIAAPSPPRS